MADQHNESDSQATPDTIPHPRSSEDLPALPSRNGQASPQLSITTQLPYHDDPNNDDINLATLQAHLRTQLSPPGYEPMYDYLRSQQRPQDYAQMSGQPPLYTPSEAHSSPVRVQEPYRDEPFVVNIEGSWDGGDDSEGAGGDGEVRPPSYLELYRQHEAEMRRLANEFDTDGSPTEQAEELVKWVVAMLLVCLTVAGVGTAFNWGRPM